MTTGGRTLARPRSDTANRPDVSRRCDRIAGLDRPAMYVRPYVRPYVYVIMYVISAGRQIDGTDTHRRGYPRRPFAAHRNEDYPAATHGRDRMNVGPAACDRAVRGSPAGAGRVAARAIRPRLHRAPGRDNRPAAGGA